MRRTRRSLWEFLAAALALSCGGGVAQAQGLPGAAFLLPRAKGVHVSWVLAPRLDLGSGATAEPAKVFAVDAGGSPWFGDAQQKVAEPSRSLVFGLDLPYDDFSFSGDGELVFAARNTLGLAVPTKKPRFDGKGLPLLALRPLLKTPLNRMRLYPAPRGLYLAGASRDGYALYSLERPSKGPAVLKKLLAAGRPITAVAGNGSRVFAALGDVVLELGRDSAKAKGIFHAKLAVTGLAWVQGAGLFYCTAKGGGFIDPATKRSLDFFSAKNPSICGRKGALYIYLSQAQGVARLDGAGRFKKLLEP